MLSATATGLAPTVPSPTWWRLLAAAASLAVILAVSGAAHAERSPLPTSGIPPSLQAQPLTGPGTGRRLQGLCVDDFARAPVIEAGRETDIIALFAPHRTTQALAGHPGWTFVGIGVAKQRIEATLVGPSGETSTLKVAWHGCVSDDDLISKSFGLTIEGAAGPAKTLANRVIANDTGGFFRSFAMPSGYRKTAKSGTQGAALPDWDGHGVGDESYQMPLTRHLNVIIVLLLFGCLLSWLVEFPFLLKELRLIGSPGARTTWITLFGIMLGALLVRHLAGSTFIREAYPFPNVAWQLEGTKNVLMGQLDAYPKGPETLMHWLGPALSDDPYEAWFLARIHMGTLTVFWSFVVGATLFKRRAAGLAFAAVLAFLPHHVRISATESTHVDFIFFGSAAVALLITAARNGRFTTFLAATLTAVATALTRPEAALVVVGFVILALAAGPQIRNKWKSPLHVGVALFLAWCILPQMMHVLGDDTTKNFAPDSKYEGLNFDALFTAIGALGDPTGGNALFDWQISPLWVYPSVFFGAVMLWRKGQRGVAVGLSVVVFTYLFLYSGLPASVTLWKMGRYHSALLIGAVPLMATGLWLALEHVAYFKLPWRRSLGVAAVSLLGLAIWWPAIAGLPMDWQKDAQFIIELGRKHADTLQGESARIILPDNRRRFLDQSPRKAVVPLTQQKGSIESGVTIAHALEFYRPPGRPHAVPAYYYEGLFCFMARDPEQGEEMNPQCDAMRKTFDLEVVDSLEVGPEVYLNKYLNVRPAGSLTFRLYRVGRRKLHPAAALKMLPPPEERHANRKRDIAAPFGHATSQYMEPVVPPL